MIYAASICATMDVPHGDYVVTRVRHNAYVIFADDTELALQEALAQAKRECPSSEGWSEPNVIVAVVPKKMIEEARLP